jgi:XTP/dITP diphosphohydrolase
MPGLSEPRTLLIATSNPGKVREIAALLTDLPGRWRFICLADLAHPPQPPAETHGSYRANAQAKAEYYTRATGLWSLADDSGLEVDALDGAPGIHSARYAGPQGDAVARNAKLLRDLAALPDERRTARFRTVMVLVAPDGRTWETEGSLEGRIGHEPRGANGFGYDPLFVLGEKNAISHRAVATLRIKPILAALTSEMP